MIYCRSTQLRERTMYSYEQTLRLFERWCSDELKIYSVDKVTENVIRKYINDLQERGKYTFYVNDLSKVKNYPDRRRDYRKPVSVTTINNYIRNIRVFFNWLERDYVVKRNPMKRVRQLKNNRQAKDYIERLIFLIPFIHAFGRVGCYRAGCCYGMAYDGFGAVVYSPGTLAPYGIPLFPVQLVEAALLILISVVLMCFTLQKKTELTVPMYFITYGIVRFILEFYRGDAVRGNYLFFSTSQWISIALIASGSAILFRVRAKKEICSMPQ